MTTSDAPVTRPDLDALIELLLAMSRNEATIHPMGTLIDAATALAAERARADQLAVVIDQLREWRTEWARAGHLDQRMQAILDAAPIAEQRAIGTPSPA